MTSRETNKEFIEQPQVNVQHNITTERYVKPVITEVHEKKIIEHVTRPETHVIQEPDTIVYLNEDQKITADSGFFDSLVVPPLPSQNTLTLITGKSLRRMWGLSRTGDLYELLNGYWKHVPTQGLKLIYISASRKKNMLFALDSTGDLYRFNDLDRKMKFVGTEGNKLVCVSPAGKRKIYGVKNDGTVLLISISRLGHSSVTRIGDRMKLISVGGKHYLRTTEIWGLGQDNFPYRYHHNVWYKFNVPIQDISVTKDNAVYAVGTNGSLYKWDGHNNFIRQIKTFKTDVQKGHQEGYPILTNVMAFKERTKVFSIDRSTGKLMKMKVF